MISLGASPCQFLPFGPLVLAAVCAVVAGQFRRSSRRTSPLAAELGSYALLAALWAYSLPSHQTNGAGDTQPIGVWGEGSAREIAPLAPAFRARPSAP